ncbi:HTH CENPB-type domain-containing protein [Trichonephila clavipes]|nr:HTH CENPB-type domain-containing protein [Trichonephila clavipes]
MLPKDVDNKLISFQKYVIGLRKQKKYLLSHIGNMDETPVTFGMIGSKTIDMKGTKTIRKKTTVQFTVVLSCLADGAKFKPIIINSAKIQFRERCFHSCTRKRVDENGVKLWVKNIWQRRPGALRNPQSLLVWDMFRSLTDNTKNF